MKRLLPAVLCAAALTTVLTLSGRAFAAEDAPADAAPKPDLITNAWKLDFKYATPNTIAIEHADGSVDWYWYMTYKVTNYDHSELFFDPRIVIQDDAGRIVTANLGVDTSVFKAVRDLVRNPLMMSPVEVPGRLFKGEEFARESVAIWPVNQKDVDAFKVFVGGVYGETKPVLDPATGEPIMVPVIDVLTGEQKKDIDGSPLMQPLQTHRTKLLSYKTPGTTETRQAPEIELVEEKDVMR